MISEIEDNTSPQELSDIYSNNKYKRPHLGSQDLEKKNSQNLEKKNSANFLDLSYHPIERKEQRLNSKKVLENTLQGNLERGGSRRISLKYRNLNELEYKKIREEQVEEINDESNSGLLFVNMKESDLPATINISDRKLSSDYNLSPSKEYKMFEINNISHLDADSKFGTNRYRKGSVPSSNTTSLFQTDIKHKLQNWERLDFNTDVKVNQNDKSDVKIDYVDEADGVINSKLEDVLVKAKSKSKSTIENPGSNREDISKGDVNSKREVVQDNEVILSNKNKFENNINISYLDKQDLRKDLKPHPVDENNNFNVLNNNFIPLMATKKISTNSLNISEDDKSMNANKAGKSFSISVSKDYTDGPKDNKSNQGENLSISANSGDISKTEVLIKDTMIVPKTYRTDIKSDTNKTDILKPTVLMNPNDTDSFIKINEESVYDYSGLGGNGSDKFNNNMDGKNLEISEQSLSSSGYENSLRDDIDISGSENEFDEENELIRKIMKQNLIDMVCDC
jgi:hypothetical protein